jgi:PAS domain S-box-containing protein
MKKAKSGVTNLIDSFRDISNDHANAMRARKVVSATVAQALLACLIIAAIPKETLFTIWPSICLALFFILLRAILGFSYRQREFKFEQMWAGAFSFVTLGCALGWSIMTVCFLVTTGKINEDALMMLILSSGFAAAGAAGLLPDRALARAYACVLLIPLTILFATKWGGSSYLVSLVLMAYLAFLIQQIQSQSSMMRELIHRQEKYKALVNASQEMVLIHRDGIVLEVNPAFEKEFGYTAEEIIGRHALSLTSFDEHELAGQILKRQESGHRIANLLRKDGSKFKGEIFSQFFTYRDLKCKMVCIQNVTDRLEAEEVAQASMRQVEAVSLERSREAFASARMKSEFVANMSHEIRTPLNAVIGFIELLNDTNPSEVQKRYLRTMSESSELLLTLINDVLDFSKIDAGKLELENLQFSVSSVIESQADLLSSRAQQKGVNFVTSIDSDLPAMVRGDAGRIGQILLNLIGNAIKFTALGHIEVRAFSDSVVNGKAVVRFEVVDTGEGLAPGVAQRLFRPFTQADSSTSRKHGGTGLGLSICKRLVEAMGGTIGVESSYGTGSKFWFNLPLEIVDAETTRTKFSRDDWSSRQIFVISDENNSARSVARYLQSWGLNATIGSSNWITMASGSRRVYDVVIASASFRRRTQFVFDGPVIEIQNEGGPYMEMSGAFASLTNPVRQSDLYNVILNALSLETPPTLSKVQAAPVPVMASRGSEGLSQIDARVLVAEDNSTNQMLALAHLRKLGISAQPVSNGVEALEALARGSYDLVLMDCQMPEMDGFEATRRIREIEKRTGQRIPIVALTANAFEEDRQRCLDVGMDAYLAKPLRREQLVAVLKQFLTRAA